MATWQEELATISRINNARRYEGLANMPEVLLGDNRWTTESPVQQPSNPGGAAWLPLAAYGTGLALGNSYNQGYFADILTPNVNSVPMEGPMRFAGRGIPRWKDYPGKAGPDYPDVEAPEEVNPTPRFPIHPGGPPISIWETSPDGGPRRGSRGDRQRPIVPEVVYPPKDTRSAWEIWRDGFRDDWKAK